MSAPQTSSAKGALKEMGCSSQGFGKEPFSNHMTSLVLKVAVRKSGSESPSTCAGKTAWAPSANTVTTCFVQRPGGLAPLFSHHAISASYEA
jgi:hypothetical protein